MNDFLFVCQENRLRSPTCEHIARLLGYAADSAGTSPTAVRPLTVEAIERAAVVICMQEFHERCVLALMERAYGSTFKRTALVIEVWNIPDDFSYCEPKLAGMVRELLIKRKASHGRI